MYKSNLFISYFNDILVRGMESIGIRCAVFAIIFAFLFKNSFPWGRLGGTAVKHLPSAQGVIPALWDRAPHQAALL